MSLLLLCLLLTAVAAQPPSLSGCRLVAQNQADLKEYCCDAGFYHVQGGQILSWTATLPDVCSGEPSSVEPTSGPADYTQILLPLTIASTSLVIFLCVAGGVATFVFCTCRRNGIFRRGSVSTLDGAYVPSDGKSYRTRARRPAGADQAVPPPYIPTRRDLTGAALDTSTLPPRRFNNPNEGTLVSGV